MGLHENCDKVLEVLKSNKDITPTRIGILKRMNYTQVKKAIAHLEKLKILHTKKIGFTTFVNMGAAKND